MNSKSVFFIGLLTLFAWVSGIMMNYNADIETATGLASNPIIITLGVFTLSLFMFGFGAPVAMFLVGLSNGITLQINWKASLISMCAAWLSAYASIRLGTSLLADFKGQGNLKNAIRINVIILVVAILIATSLDLFPELGIPEKGTEIAAPENMEKIIELYPNGDAYVDEEVSDENYKSAELLKIGTKNGEKWALMSFDIPDKKIKEAKLYLYVRDYDDALSERIVISVTENPFFDDIVDELDASKPEGIKQMFHNVINRSVIRNKEAGAILGIFRKVIDKIK